MPMQQMEWSRLVDELMRLAKNFERGEVKQPDYGSEYRRLIKLLADEIRSDPYGSHETEDDPSHE